ncbi:MAG: flavin reductase family protein [Actinomycetota bacterium]|nr:flavin reductase family protein [Actinomycetota bacterium]
MDHPAGRIHFEHPFATPLQERDPARRFRGRLAAPVTVWTAGAASRRGALTISSLLVAEGEPALILGLVSDVSELWAAIQDSAAFVVHVLDVNQRRLADRFALRIPAPGGVFADLEVSESRWGPILAEVPTRACCRLEGTSPVGYAQLVSGRIERLDLDEDLDHPLVYFRGHYQMPSPQDDRND